MAGVHLVFHVSQLKKSEKGTEANQMRMELLDLQDTLEYAEYLVTPEFEGKLECIKYMCARIKLHTRNDSVNIRYSAKA
jgi:hypothetical protein